MSIQSYSNFLNIHRSFLSSRYRNFLSKYCCNCNLSVHHLCHMMLIELIQTKKCQE